MEQDITISTEGTDWNRIPDSEIEAHSPNPVPQGPVFEHDGGKELGILNENAGEYDIQKPDPEAEPWVVLGDNFMFFFESQAAAKEYVNEAINGEKALPSI